MSGLRSNFKTGFEERVGAELVTNGAFAADTNWTKGTGWTIAAGVAACDGTQVAASDLSQSSVPVLSHKYRMAVTVTRTAGVVTPVLGTVLGTARSTDATFTEDIVCGLSLVLSGTYQWTVSAGGTNEYYCDIAGGGNPGLTQPTDVWINDLRAASAAIGSLTAGTWGWGDGDTLGYSTVYVRLSDGADPDSKADGFVKDASGGAAKSVAGRGDADYTGTLDDVSVKEIHLF